MNYTIMIVDDEERMRKLIAAYLKKEGYTTVEAANGLEALNIFKNGKIDIVLLDVMMPIMDGWTVCTELRKISDVPVIMLTAKGEDEDKILGFELGTDHYVTKPFNMKVLIAKIKSLINRVYNYEKSTQKILNFDGLTIDELSHTVSLNGIEINLSPKEYYLLVYFTVNKGIVLTREKILDAIWGIDFYGDLRIVDTYIKRVREKLQEKACLISTVRGAGYRFEG